MITSAKEIDYTRPFTFVYECNYKNLPLEKDIINSHNFRDNGERMIVSLFRDKFPLCENFKCMVRYHD